MANTTNTCVINITFTKASTRSNIVSGDNLSNACGKIAKYLETSAGEIVAGKSYVIDGAGYIAGDGAEVFNNYTNNKAVGNYSHAEGNNTIALGNNSHAEGQNSKTLGVCSHAEGNNTTAKGQSQHAEGEFNAIDESVSSSNPRGTFAHIIGNGTSNSNRSNAYAIGWDGKIYQPSDPNADSDGVFLSSKADKATTIAGYGIIDAKFTPSTGTIQLGSNTLVPVRTIQINGTAQTNTNGTVNIPVASTSAYGATMLSDSVSSTDTTKAATANAVKTAYDEGVTALEYSANTGVKNLCKPTIEDIIPTTSGGFQLIVNEDGSITTSGTSSTEYDLVLERFIPEKTEYYLFSSGIQQTDYTNKPYLYTTVNGESVYATLTGTRVLLEEGTIYDIKLYIKSNYANNETYYPMIRSYDITDYTYQPYAMSNVDLTHEVNTVVNDGVKNLVRYNLTVPAELKATVNVDGSITVTASTTNIRRLTIATDLNRLVDGKTYILSGCTGGNSSTTYHLGITKSNYAGLIYQTTREIVFQKTSEMALLVLTVRSGQSWTKTFYPMIREATVTDEKFRSYALPNPELTACALSDINNGGVNLFDIYRWHATSNIVITDKGDEKINLACNGSSSALIEYYIPKLIPKIVYRVTLFVDSLTVTSGNNPVIQAYSQNNSGNYNDSSFSIIDPTTISSTGVYTWDVTVSNKTYPGLEILINMAKNAATTNNMDFRLMICERSYTLADPTYKMYSESNAALTQMTAPQFRPGPLTDSMLPYTTSVIFGDNSSVAGVSGGYVVVRTYCYNYDSKSENVLAIQIAEFDTGVRKTRKRIGSSWGTWV